MKVTDNLHKKHLLDRDTPAVACLKTPASSGRDVARAMLDSIDDRLLIGHYNATRPCCRCWRAGRRRRAAPEGPNPHPRRVPYRALATGPHRALDVLQCQVPKVGTGVHVAVVTAEYDGDTRRPAGAQPSLARVGGPQSCALA